MSFHTNQESCLLHAQEELVFFWTLVCSLIVIRLTPEILLPVVAPNLLLGGNQYSALHHSLRQCGLVLIKKYFQQLKSQSQNRDGSTAHHQWHLLGNGSVWERDMFLSKERMGHHREGRPSFLTDGVQSKDSSAGWSAQQGMPGCRWSAKDVVHMSLLVVYPHSTLGPQNLTGGERIQEGSLLTMTHRNGLPWEVCPASVLSNMD